MKLRPSIVIASLVLVGCGGFVSSIFGDDEKKDDPGGGPTTGGLLPGQDASADGAKPCTGLCQRQIQCPGGLTTSLSGTVMDPAGKNGLYNILVYVPNAPVAPIKTGASCDRCGSVSGDPLVTALTDAKGHFKLDNVPVGKDVPLVVQIGKWRRQLVVPNVEACKDTPLANDAIRLPKNKSEGDIPQIAITTGGADVMECLLRKVGLDDSEFTTEAGDGRVHFYAGGPNNNTTTRAFDGAHGGASFSPADAFWSDNAAMMKYDIVILSCEGQTFSGTKPPQALQALYDYANAGGRVFASHWHRYWFNTAAQGQNPAGPPSPFEPFATWNDRAAPGDQNPPKVATGIIDDSFPKGAAMKEWLVNTGASTTPGQIPINESKHNVDAVDGTKATQWITMTNQYANNMTAVEYLSFNTPILAPDEQKCGRVVYSDLHVSSGDTHGPAWPSGCTKPELSPQEKALEFMLFDLSSCIQSDKLPPTPPPPVK
jgi:hypothetical protein